LSFELRASSFALVIACGGPHAEEAVVQPLPASPSAAATVAARSREPDRAQVLEFCERYRHAMEARDADALMALVSKRYDDDGVTYATLATTMKRLLAGANQIRYEIRYGDITTRADGAIEVDYTYSASFLTASGWQHRVSDAKLVLERRGDSLAILSGM
jgi:hypothetical protein